MAMNWQKVRQVLDNMYTNKQLAGKIGNENAHEDYMLIKETSMAVGEEAKDVFDKELEKKMTASQMEKAQDLARECMKKKFKGC